MTSETAVALMLLAAGMILLVLHCWLVLLAFGDLWQAINELHIIIACERAARRRLQGEHDTLLGAHNSTVYYATGHIANLTAWQQAWGEWLTTNVSGEARRGSMASGPMEAT